MNSYTYDLYYDPENSRDPWTIATSGAREYGFVISSNITDNGFNLDGTETDDELSAWADDLAANTAPVSYNGDDGEPVELDRDVQAAGVLRMMTFIRDAIRRADAAEPPESLLR